MRSCCDGSYTSASYLKDLSTAIESDCNDLVWSTSSLVSASHFANPEQELSYTPCSPDVGSARVTVLSGPPPGVDLRQGAVHDGPGPLQRFKPHEAWQDAHRGPVRSSIGSPLR